MPWWATRASYELEFPPWPYNSLQWVLIHITKHCSCILHNYCDIINLSSKVNRSPVQVSNLFPNYWSWCSLINPNLDYACNVWNPYLSQDMCTIEKLQRRAPNLFRHSSNNHIIKDYQFLIYVPSLQYCRLRMDLTWPTYKVLHGTVNHNRIILLPWTLTPPELIDSKFISIIRSNKTVRRYSFSQRITDQWNRLPLEIVDAVKFLSSKT